MVVGLYLLSLMDADTSVATASAYMFVLGLGLGLVMQVLVLAVQNAVPYSQLGVATSGATLFRSIGGSFGASILGAIFAAQLTHNLALAFPGQASLGSGHFDPSSLAQLPPAVHDAYVRAFNDSLNVVFLVAAVIGLAAFALTWFIKELPLRGTVATAGVGEAFAVAKDTDPLAEFARELSILTRREQAERILERLAARAGVDLEPAETWLLGRFNRDPSLDVHALADAYAIDRLTLDNAECALIDAGLVDGGEPGSPGARALTEKGKQTLDTLISRGCDRLEELSDGWQPEQHPELREVIQSLARQFIDTTPVAPGAPQAS
jgi:DNA-binding MarR family transcriptional regulator